MFDYLQVIQKILDIGEGKRGSITIINKDGYIEFHRNLSFPDTPESKKIERMIVGRHVLDIYENLTEESSTVMQALRTGKVVRKAQQVLVTADNLLRSPVNCTTIPMVVDGEIIGAIDYCIRCTNWAEPSNRMNSQLYTTDSIITQNEEMRKLKDKIIRVSWSDSPVLIYGETGTGKELVAQAIHSSGNRAFKPFLSQNCAAIPLNLLESTFFGTEKGSFTGAESKQGLFELADGGTLFLDEINSMDGEMQAKLLKALEEKKVRRIGGNKDIAFDTRIICATNEKPEVLLAQKRMRRDLYYRIGVVQIDILPLRERREDIPLLTEHFIQMFNMRMNRQIRGMSQIVEQIFQNAEWPGNVRELKNVVESAFNNAQGELIVANDVPQILRNSFNHLKGSLQDNAEIPDYLNVLLQDKASRQEPVPIPEGVPAELVSAEKLETALKGEGISLQEILNQCEEYLIRQALSHESKLCRVAERLSISPQRLYYRMDRLGMRLPK